MYLYNYNRFSLFMVTPISVSICNFGISNASNIVTSTIVE